jgi:hypothetical protein
VKIDENVAIASSKYKFNRKAVDIKLIHYMGFIGDYSH